MQASEIIRLIGDEFSEIEDSKIESWITVVRPMVSKKLFGSLYEQALAYLVCHKLKMSGCGNNPLGKTGEIISSFSVSSVSEGGSSISFGVNQSSNLAKDAELALTSYGLQFLTLKRIVIVPIRTGEDG